MNQRYRYVITITITSHVRKVKARTRVPRILNSSTHVPCVYECTCISSTRCTLISMGGGGGGACVHRKGDEKETIAKCNFDVAALCRVGA